MPDFAFGGPRGGIIQMAYTVADIRAAIAYWIRDLKVGPWFLLDHFTGADPVYRGGPSQADVAIAMAFAGHMQIELIQPNDDHPSVYRETITRRGPRLPPFRPRQRRYRGGHRRA
jgi:glutathione S-transferase